MKTYKVKITPNAVKDMKDRISYLINVKKNPQAAKNVMSDYQETRERLSYVAGSIKESDNAELRRRGLRRLNFKRHDYFILFMIEGEVATITNIFHALEDYENKLI